MKVNSVGMINLLESILFMVPAIKTKGIKKAVGQSGKGGGVHSIESDCGRADFTLIIQRLLYACHQRHGAGCSSQAAWRARRDSQNLYRDYESIRPRTASKNESMRILLLFFPMFLYAWALVRHLLQYSCPGMHVTLKGFRLFLALKEFDQAPDMTCAF